MPMVLFDVIKYLLLWSLLWANTMVNTPGIGNIMVWKLYTTFFTIPTYVHGLCSLDPRIFFYILPLSFLYLWTNIPLENLLVIYVLDCILILLPSCWHLYQLGFHQGQHIIHDSNNLSLCTWWKPIFFLVTTTCKYL